MDDSRSQPAEEAEVIKDAERTAASQEPEDAERWGRLTAKQRACLDLLVERKTSKQIARLLGIAKPTVDQRILTARSVLGAADRDEAALQYLRLRATYDRVIYDPACVPLPPKLMPSDFPNGDPAENAIKDCASPTEGSSGLLPPFGEMWRPDQALSRRGLIIATMIFVVVILILAGLGIGQALTRLISG